ncbi:unnamed protein product [Zymoseptoria tritici ST99CH_3D1]|nr:unnamed protein product [Zymoseptoria tritici ST99CH_3D1]
MEQHKSTNRSHCAEAMTPSTEKSESSDKESCAKESRIKKDSVAEESSKKKDSVAENIRSTESVKASLPEMLRLP